MTESELVMREIDRMPVAFRALVHEFGFLIVGEMMNEGYEDAEELRGILENWRDRRQNEWLATDYITPRTKAGFLHA